MKSDEHVGVVISDVARLLRTAFDRRVRPLGLTRSQWLVLTRLHRHPGASQSELAEMLEIEKASAGRMIDRLELKGWVQRRAQQTDRRVKRVFLTPEAEQVHARIWPIAENTVDDALAGLSDVERRQLLALLLRVKRRVTGIVDDTTGSRRDIADRGSRSPGPRANARRRAT